MLFYCSILSTVCGFVSTSRCQCTQAAKNVAILKLPPVYGVPYRTYSLYRAFFAKANIAAPWSWVPNLICCMADACHPISSSILDRSGLAGRCGCFLHCFVVRRPITTANVCSCSRCSRHYHLWRSQFVKPIHRTEKVVVVVDKVFRKVIWAILDPFCGSTFRLSSVLLLQLRCVHS